MIIHEPEIITKDGHTILFSRVEPTTACRDFPSHIWYRFPEQYSDFLSKNTDAFVMPGLLAGMYYHENVEIRGSVSPKLAYHLDEYKFQLKLCSPNKLGDVQIQYHSLKAETQSGKGVGAPFSGGVDSSFTLYKHLPEQQPDQDYQATHAFFIHGFNLLPSEKEVYDTMYKKFLLHTTRIGVELVPCSTNVCSVTYQRLPLITFNGSLIISTAMSISGLLKRFLAPGNYRYERLLKEKNTDSPLMSRLLSTDTLEIIHHGAAFSRMEKVKEIADWDLAREALAVCWSQKRELGGENCCRCEKCVRTMIPLYILGKLDVFTTFDHKFKSNHDLLKWGWHYRPTGSFEPQIFTFAKNHRPQLLPWLRVGAALGTIRWLLTRLVPKFLVKKLRLLGYYSRRADAPNAHEFLEVNKIISKVS